MSRCQARSHVRAGHVQLGRADGRPAKKMHRVGVASVQLTRSTAAEATACRECLQPSALRARCNSQSSREFHARQAPADAIRRKLRISCFRRGPGSSRVNAERGFRLELGPRKSAPRPVHPRPTSRPTAAEATAARRAINLRRSVLGAIGRLRLARRRRQVDGGNHETRYLRLFLYNTHTFASKSHML